MINLLKVYYEDNVGKITGYRQLPDNELWDDTKFKQVDEYLYDYVVSKYELGDLTFNDASVELNVDNINFKPFDQINAMKNNAINIYINNELRDGDSAFDMFLLSTKFTLLNNQFLAAGFYFTADNKEEIYLSVLNSGDELLIGMLEDYIENLNEMSEYIGRVNNYTNMKKDLNEAITVQEVLDIYSSYTARNLVDDMNR